MGRSRRNAVYRRRRPITESAACAKGRGHHGARARCGETRAHSCMRERSRKTARNAGEQANLLFGPLCCLSRAKLCAALGNGQITSRAQWGGNGDDPALRPAHLANHIVRSVGELHHGVSNILKSPSTYNVSSLTSGIYSVKLTDINGKTVVTKKIIKL